MWRCGEQQQVALRVLGQALEQIKAQLLTRPTAGTGVGFVHDDALWRDAQKVFPVALALDVVQADHHDGVVVEQAHAMRQIALYAAGTGGGKCDGLHIESA